MQRLGSIVVVLAILGAVALACGAGVALAQEEPTPTPSGNATDDGASATPIDQHDDPRNVSEEGDLGQLSDWLGGHLSDRLESGMIELSQGQYDSVEGLLGDEFESRLSQYVDVAGETNAEGDDRAAETVEDTADDQREFTDDVQRYRETHEAYREAREQGNNDAAREYARDLADLEREIRNDGADIRRGYDAIANATGRNLTAGDAAVTDIVTNVSDTQAEVRQATFVETDLAVTANRSVARFDRPARIGGRLVAENGSALAERSITVQVGGRNYSTRTDARGRFSVTYRPVTIATNVDVVSVTYRPQSASAYLQATENVSLSIESVEPTVEIADAAGTVAYGESVVANASVTVDGRPVPNASVSLAVDEYGLTTARTGASGGVRLAPRLPAAVDDGERAMAVEAGTAGRAIEPATATAAVSVGVTETELATAAASDGGGLTVTGTLRTADGRPVPDQSIVVSAAGNTETVTTNATGGYAVSLDRATPGDAGRTITVSAAFDGAGTNLGDANASAAATLPPANGGGAGDGAATDAVPWPVVAAGLAALAALGGIVLVYVRWNGTAGEKRPTGDVDDGDSSVPTTTDAQRWLIAARTALDAGDERGAIARAYAASYAHVAERLGVGTDRTPRELLAAAEPGVDRDELEALATVADGYERTAFAGGRDVGAAGVLESATRLVEGREGQAESTDD